MLRAIRNNIPNAITSLNLLCGTLAIVAAFSGHSEVLCGLRGYELASLLIAAGAVADFCDGLGARLFGAVSGFGRELDSLCDLVTFGLAPAMMVYNLLSEATAGSAWCLLTAMIPVCGAIRLARFNVDTDQATTFKGMPIPANAIFWIGEAMWIATAQQVALWRELPLVVALSLLMVCNLPMFSFKMHGWALSQCWAQFLLIIAAVVLIAVFGLTGLAYTIAVYVLLSVVKCIAERENNK